MVSKVFNDAPRRVLIMAAVISVVAAACSSGTRITASSSRGVKQDTSSTPIVLTADIPQYGTVLTTSSGFVLYTYTADNPGGPGCDPGCLKIWPPLLLPSGTTVPVGGPGVTGLGTFQRGGRLQVTWNGLPLYTFITDKQPGQVTGQNVVDSGGKWILAVVTPAAASPTTKAPASQPSAQPASTQPPATRPPSTEPPMTEPPATQPTSTQPPATSPPSTSPRTTPPTTAPPLPSY